MKYINLEKDLSNLKILTELRFYIGLDYYEKEYNLFSKKYKNHPLGFLNIITPISNIIKSPNIYNNPNISFKDRLNLLDYVCRSKIKTVDKLLKSKRYKQPTELLLKYYSKKDIHRRLIQEYISKHTIKDSIKSS